MLPTRLDHCVIHVSEWQRSNIFYTQVLGATLVTREAGFAYRSQGREFALGATDSLASQRQAAAMAKAKRPAPA